MTEIPQSNEPADYHSASESTSSKDKYAVKYKKEASKLTPNAIHETYFNLIKERDKALFYKYEYIFILALISTFVWGGKFYFQLGLLFTFITVQFIISVILIYLSLTEEYRLQNLQYLINELKIFSSAQEISFEDRIIRIRDGKVSISDERNPIAWLPIDFWDKDLFEKVFHMIRTSRNNDYNNIDYKKIEKLKEVLLDIIIEQYNNKFNGNA